MCAIDGEIQLAMVPHVYRQEMMPTATTSYYHENLNYEMEVGLDVNESPINLFKPDFKKFPSAYFIDHCYMETLEVGDCMYIPAYYFYQVSGISEASPKTGNYKASALLTAHHYKPHSKLLIAFYDAIEKGILT